MEKRYVTNESRKQLARTIVEESIVLLKNDNQCLPLEKGTAAFWGNACFQPVIGGSGSGASFTEADIPDLCQACEAAGLIPEQEVKDFYMKNLAAEDKNDAFQDFIADMPNLVASGAIYEFWGRYNGQDDELSVPEDLAVRAAAKTRKSIIVLNRKTGGEECDRRIKNDFELLKSERELLDVVCRNFPEVILILNVNGMIDLSWVSDYPSIHSILYIGTPGEQGMPAVANILAGNVAPSGKLSFTIAESYEAYPTSKDFSFDKDLPDQIKEYSDYGMDETENGSIGFEKSPVTVYREDIYMGYRYFDSFGKDVLYPFGFGMTYADFKISDVGFSKDGEKIQVSAYVTNISSEYAGKEVVQIYVSKPQGELENPYQDYLGCAKTACLAPGESERVVFEFRISDMASYHENRAAWILEEGIYYVRVGTSSRNTHIAGALEVKKSILCEQANNILSIRPENKEKIDFLSSKECKPITYPEEQDERNAAGIIPITDEDISPVVHAALDMDWKAEAVVSTLADVKSGKVSMEQFLSQLSIEELAVLLNGYGPGLPFGLLFTEGESTIQYEDGTNIGSNSHKTGNMGYISPALNKYGIPSTFYKDGPSGVGKTAWPTPMLLACSFNEDLFYSFGEACGYEAEQQDIDSWLAPGLNLIRNPLGGRNFEYFSEDPVAAGICGMRICQGVTENTGVTPCPKHFALNEQETYRRGNQRKNYDAVDSIANERVSRELYLKPFEMVIKNCDVRTIMTSFNKINGTFAAGNHDLCTRLLRGEWGYAGAVITDWGDMDVVVDGADAVAAGNDVIMPGGPPVIAQVLEGYKEGRVTKEQLTEAASHLLFHVMRSKSFSE